MIVRFALMMIVSGLLAVSTAQAQNQAQNQAGNPIENQTQGGSADRDCGPPDATNLEFLECQALVLWDQAEAKREVARQYLQAAAKIRAQCAEQAAQTDEASCSIKSMDYEVEAGFLIQEGKEDARKAEALADEYWRLKEGAVPSDEEANEAL